MKYTIGCASSQSFGQKRGISKRDSASHKLLSIIHLNGIEMMRSSFGKGLLFDLISF